MTVGHQLAMMLIRVNVNKTVNKLDFLRSLQGTVLLRPAPAIGVVALTEGSATINRQKINEGAVAYGRRHDRRHRVTRQNHAAVGQAAST